MRPGGRGAVAPRETKKAGRSPWPLPLRRQGEAGRGLRQRRRNYPQPSHEPTQPLPGPPLPSQGREQSSRLPPLLRGRALQPADCAIIPVPRGSSTRSEEHTSELQSLMRISYAVFCLKKKNKKQTKETTAPKKRITQN